MGADFVRGKNRAAAGREISRPSKSKPAAPAAVTPPWQRPPQPVPSAEARPAEALRCAASDLSIALSRLAQMSDIAAAIGGPTQRAFAGLIESVWERVNSARFTISEEQQRDAAPVIKGTR